jgi:hypothetical protein
VAMVGGGARTALARRRGGSRGRAGRRQRNGGRGPTGGDEAGGGVLSVMADGGCVQMCAG